MRDGGGGGDGAHWECGTTADSRILAGVPAGRPESLPAGRSPCRPAVRCALSLSSGHACDRHMSVGHCPIWNGAHMFAWLIWEH